MLIVRRLPITRVLLTRILQALLVFGPAGLFLAACEPKIPAAPPQPIAYSHKAHIDAGLECTRCHRGAERVKEAGLPEMAACVTCHRRRIPDHPEVIKIKAFYDRGEPLLWRKVNVMPREAMVHFDHGAHARVEIGCEVCHGDVGQMTLAQRVIDTANMGWCVQCHTDNGASIDCLTCHH